MGYKVLKKFRDTTNNKKLVKAGDTYEHEDADRIAHLISKGFLKGKENQPSKGEIKHTGGGWYMLPDGKKVQGKEEAQAALNNE